MLSLIRLCILLAGLCFVLAGQPIISEGGVVNAASYTLPGLPYYGIAQGSMFVIKGQDLGPDPLQIAPAVPLPTQLADTSVQVTVEGTTVDAIMYYTWTSQVACILPSATPTGEGTVTVTYNGQASDPAPILVVESAPGIFTWNSAGFGQAVVQNYISPEEMPVPNALNHVAEPGQAVTIWATGLGAIPGDDAGVPPVGDIGTDRKVLLGNMEVQPGYAGRSGAGFPSIDQVNFVVPAGIEGCRVPLALMSDGMISNYTTMAISSSGETCSDQTEFAPGVVEQLFASGGASVGVILLGGGRGEFFTPLGIVPVHLDIASAAFYYRDSWQIAAGQHLRANEVQPGPPTPGTCTFYSFPRSEELKFSPTDPVPFMPLDAGPSLTLTGAAGVKQIGLLMPGVPGIYLSYVGGGLPGGDIQPDYLDPGDYTVSNGPAGEQSTVGQFSAAISIPSPVVWDSATVSEVSRDQDLLFTWEGGNAGKELVLLNVASDDVAAGVSGVVACTAPVEAGTFTVPRRMLSNLPASTPWDFSGLPPGAVVVGTAPTIDATSFQAPGLDLGVIDYGYWQFRNVDVK